MTVAELIKELQKFPSAIEVKVIWDAVIREITASNLYVSKCGLIIDADGNQYKDEIEEGIL